MGKGRTLIYHDGALGDVLLSLPCISEIKGNSGFLHIAGRPDVARFLRDAGWADEISSTGSCLYTSLFTGQIEERTRDFLSRFDRIVVFTANDDSTLVERIRKANPGTEAVMTVPPEGIGMHVTEYRLRQLTSSRVDTFPTSRIEVPHEYQKKARGILRRAGLTDGRTTLAMHPGSGGKEKCWPLERYFELAERLLTEASTCCLIFSGPAENRVMKEQIEDFVRAHHGAMHVRDEELLAVAALLSLSGLYIGNDSGISHLAAAVNGTVVVLFGPTDPLLWRPVGKHVRVVSAGHPNGALSEITVDTVYGVARDRLLQSAG